jgi:DNA-binding transcriptional LysR family regulator
VDLDLGQVRAFVAAADARNFSRAAEQLQLTQQALSKRIARLEGDVGTLFARRPGGVALTARGVRFLPAARELLAAADEAAATARTGRTPPLRVDVWGHLHPPYALVQAFAEARPDLVVETSMRRNLPLALRAVQRRELDAALGNVAGLGRPLPSSMTSEPVTTTPLAALLNTRHPLAGRSQLLPSDLSRHQLWWPTEPGSPELDRFAADYARAVGVDLVTAGRNLGLDGLLESVRSDPSRITIVSSQWPIPCGDGLRLVPIRPTPHYPWFVVWPATGAHPALAALRDHLRARGHLPRADAADVWLPATAGW